MSELAIQIIDLKKHFGGIHALRGVDMSVPKNQITAIIGDNGAGKSTLIKCISGDHVADSGTIEVHGSQVNITSPLNARTLGIETVYQDLSMINTLSVSDNLFLSREIAIGIPPFRVIRTRQMKAKSREMLDQVGAKRIDVMSKVGSLSGGQRQAVAIARAVGWGASILILDEPTAAMGVRESSEVHTLLRSLRTQGITILFISHNFEEVMELADQIVVMRQGRVVASVARDEVSAADLVGLITGAKSGI